MVKRILLGLAVMLLVVMPSGAATANAPDAPINLEVVSATEDSVTLRWGPSPAGEQFFIASDAKTVVVGWPAAQDTRGIAGYNVYRDGVLKVSNLNALQYKVSGIQRKVQSFRICVFAVNTVGQVSTPMCTTYSRL